MKTDNTDMDYYGHTACDLIVIVYALFCIRFKKLRQYLMIVFYFFKCMEYVLVANFERSPYQDLRVFFAELFIFYFCVCQMFTSSLWIRELVCCNLSFLAACIGMHWHMREPTMEEEKAEVFVPVDRHGVHIMMICTSFLVFTVVNRFIIEKRERVLFMAKCISHQQHF